MKSTKILTFLLVVAIAGFGAACSDSTDQGYQFAGSSGQAGNGYDYNGPGSAYSVLLDIDGVFYIAIADDLDSPVHTTIEGTYERFDNGFIELTVTEADGTEAPEEGDVGIALEASGFALMLRPFDGTGEFVPTVVGGDCPLDDVAGNWMMMTCNDGGVSCDASSATEDFFGTFSYDFDTETVSLPSRFTLNDGSDLGSFAVGTSSCSYGLMSLSDTAVYLTEEQGAIVHTSTDDLDDAQHIVALPEEALVQMFLAGDYVGMAFDKSDDTNVAVRMTIDETGTTGDIDEVDEEKLEAPGAGTSYGTLSISAVNEVASAPADGWITATFTKDGDPARPMYCMAATGIGDTAKTLIFCVGQSPSDTTEFYNLVMLSE